MFGRMGDNVAESLRTWWRGGPDLKKALKNEAIEDIPNAVHKAKLHRGEASARITKTMDDAYDDIIKDLRQRTQNIKDAESELGRVSRARAKIKRDMDDATREAEFWRMKAQRLGGTDSADAAMENYYRQQRRADSLADDLVRETEEVKRYKGKLDEQMFEKQELQNLFSAIEDSPQAALTQIKSSPDIRSRFPTLGSYVRRAETAMNEKAQILGSTSRYIDGDEYKFAKEYLREVHPNLGKGSARGRYAQNWMANPRNLTRLEELALNRKFQKFLDIDVGGKASREALRGLGRKELVSKLGMPAATIGLTLGPLAVMSWFSDNSEEMVADAGIAGSENRSFKASDLGAVIQRQTSQAVVAIQDAINDAESEFGKDPEKAAMTVATVIAENKEVIDKNLARWTIVINSADDPEAARRAGVHLQKYSEKIGKQMASLEKLTGEHLRLSKTPDQGLAGDVGRRQGFNPAHVKGIQSYLSKRFPGVAPTGRLDGPTVQALRELEQKFDTLGNTGRFTGSRLLVRPKEGHLIELNDLINLEKMLQRGR